jgi:uncharacterized protein YndB with AHSA1/START domain
MSERGYTIVRTFDAPRKAVWEAWTRPEQFAVWFGTDAAEMRDVDLDVRPGGAWRGTMVVPDREPMPWSGVYREVSEPELLVMDLTDGTGGEGEYETYTVVLAEVDGRTEMTLRQSGGHLSDEEYERAKAGTNSFMDTLEGLLPAIKARHETL